MGWYKFLFEKTSDSKVSNLFEDGKSIGNIEVGYSPAMSFLSKDVKIIADAHNQIPIAGPLSSYNPKDMKGVYPDGLWKQESKDIRCYLQDNFLILCDYLIKAVSHNLALIVVFT